MGMRSKVTKFVLCLVSMQISNQQLLIENENLTEYMSGNSSLLHLREPHTTTMSNLGYKRF